MTVRFKFVAIVLAFVLLAGSVPALFATCLDQDKDSVAMPMHCCGPHCPVRMAHHFERGNPSTVVTERGSCCKLSSGKTAPASVPLLAPASVEAPVSVEASPVIPYVTSHEKRVDTAATPPEVSSQAVLCTFLI